MKFHCACRSYQEISYFYVMKEKYDVKDRLRLYLRSIGMSVNQLERLAGLSNRYLNNVKFQIPLNKATSILNVLPNLNMEWLLTGKGEMTNSLFCSASAKGLTNREGVLNRIRLVIIEDGYVDIEQFETFNGLRAGTIQTNILNGDERVLINTVYNVVGGNERYSLDWVLYGKGLMENGVFYTLPIVHVEFLLNEYRQKKEWPSNNTAMSLSIPAGFDSFLVKRDGSQTFDGFVFIVPERSDFKRSTEKNITGRDERPVFANSTPERLYPYDTLICEKYKGGPLSSNDLYLLLVPEKEIVECAAYEERGGFRVDEPSPLYFGRSYYYADPKDIIVLGRVCHKITGHFCKENTFRITSLARGSQRHRTRL